MTLSITVLVEWWARSTTVHAGKNLQLFQTNCLQNYKQMHIFININFTFVSATD